MDSQPVVPSEWAQADPWKPVIKAKNATGKWEEVPQDRIYALNPDPELRFFGRSTSDDKGPIMMFMAAFDAMNSLGIQSLLIAKRRRARPLSVQWSMQIKSY